MKNETPKPSAPSAAQRIAEELLGQETELLYKSLVGRGVADDVANTAAFAVYLRIKTIIARAIAGERERCLREEGSALAILYKVATKLGFTHQGATWNYEEAANFIVASALRNSAYPPQEKK